jgi:hypothetical protein
MKAAARYQTDTTQAKVTTMGAEGPHGKSHFLIAGKLACSHASIPWYEKNMHFAIHKCIGKTTP